MVWVDFAGFNVKSTISFAPYRNTRHVNSGCQTWRLDRVIARLALPPGQASPKPLGKIWTVPSATQLLVTIIVFIKLPGHLLKCSSCCSADLKPSSQVIKYVLEEPDNVLTGGTEGERASPLSKHQTYRLPQMWHPCCLRAGDGGSKGELEVLVSGAGALSGMVPGRSCQPRAMLQGCSAAWKVSRHPRPLYKQHRRMCVLLCRRNGNIWSFPQSP